MLKKASRVDKIPRYAFADLDKKKQALKQKGVDLISLSIGDPDVPTPGWVVDELIAEARVPANHQYPAYEGSSKFRQSVADYYLRRFGVRVDPGTQVMALIGSKEGISHIIWAFVEDNDVCLVPDPAYPVYNAQTLLAGGIPYKMPLRKENGFLPKFEDIPTDVARQATCMFLNYPNNPTGAVADLRFFEDAVRFGKEFGILVCHDAAYVEMTYDGYRAPSILQVEGALDVACEFYSLSKPFNMTGWRIGAAVGCKQAIDALGVIKTNTDSGQFTAVQHAGARALAQDPEGFIGQMNDMYKRRRDALVDGLSQAGWKMEKPQGSFYVWAPVPGGAKSAEFVEELLEVTGVMVVPGPVYGEMGEGYVRMALTVDEQRIREAVERIGAYLKKMR
ncbi:MAG: LL-diaminopimelate aminotransferase [Bacillota bacterium]